MGPWLRKDGVLQVAWEQLGRTAKRARDDFDRLREAIDICPDRLSPELLNSALLAILKNQAVILENMARLQRGLAAAGAAWEAPSERRLIEAERASNELAEELGAEDLIGEDLIGEGLIGEGLVGDDEQAGSARLLEAAERNGATESEDAIVLSVRAKELSAPAGEAPSAKTKEPIRGERAERNGSATPIPPAVDDLTKAESARALQAFDNRDHNLKRGLQKMNDWLSGVTGTPFQHRPQQHFAFLRVSGLSADKILDRERDLKRYTRLTQRLGRLKYEGLEGEVWLYGR